MYLTHLTVTSIASSPSGSGSSMGSRDAWGCNWTSNGSPRPAHSFVKLLLLLHLLLVAAVARWVAETLGDAIGPAMDPHVRHILL